MSKGQSVSSLLYSLWDGKVLSSVWMHAFMISFFPFCDKCIPQHSRAPQWHAAEHCSTVWTILEPRALLHQGVANCLSYCILVKRAPEPHVFWTPNVSLQQLCTLTRGFQRDWSSPVWLREHYFWSWIVLDGSLSCPRSRGITWKSW